MIRGTTPTHRFKLPIDQTIIQSLRVIYAQGGTKVLVKELEDFKLSDGWAETKLSQEETLDFDASQAGEMQMRILTAGGDAPASGIHRTSVGRLLEDEVME